MSLTWDNGFFTCLCPLRHAAQPNIWVGCFQILFEAYTSISTRNGDVGIDDIKFSPGSCPTCKRTATIIGIIIML